MGKRYASRLVIDADIAHSAGTSEHPVASGARTFLDTVYDFGYHVTMTEAIRTEWRRHQSRYSRKWLTRMYGRRLVYRSDVGEDHGLRARLASVTPDAQRSIAEGDVHLIEAAIATDRAVSSGDERARSVFRAASKHLPELNPIVWVNPARCLPRALAWLRDGAPIDADLLLRTG